jgi:D-alanyl-D-alanine carboxypeptidase
MYKRKIALLAYLLLFCVSSAVAQQPKTLPELRAKISEVLAKPELSSAMVVIKVESLYYGRVLFEEKATKLHRPASNMKQ